MDTAPLRSYLAGCSTPVTYAKAARDLGGIRINELTQLLERAMEEDAHLGLPFIAARVISRAGPIPARGFFDKARALGRHVDAPETFHAAELAALSRLP